MRSQYSNQGLFTQSMHNMQQQQMQQSRHKMYGATGSVVVPAIAQSYTAPGAGTRGPLPVAPRGSGPVPSSLSAGDRSAGVREQSQRQTMMQIGQSQNASRQKISDQAQCKQYGDETSPSIGENGKPGGDGCGRDYDVMTGGELSTMPTDAKQVQNASGGTGGGGGGDGAYKAALAEYGLQQASEIAKNPMKTKLNKHIDYDLYNKGATSGDPNLAGESEAKEPIFSPLQRGRQELSMQIMEERSANPEEFGDKEERANQGRGEIAWELPRYYPNGRDDVNLNFVKGIQNGKQRMSIWKSRTGSRGNQLKNHNAAFWSHNPDTGTWSRLYNSAAMMNPKFSKPPFHPWDPRPDHLRNENNYGVLMKAFNEEHNNDFAMPKPALVQVGGQANDRTYSTDPFKQGPVPGHK